MSAAHPEVQAALDARIWARMDPACLAYDGQGAVEPAGVDDLPDEIERLR